MVDQTDIQILNLLKDNSRLQWREIGERVHLTGQAVKNRIDRMEKMGIIEGYTIKINPNSMGNNLMAFITVYMRTTDHLSFHKFIKENFLVIEANRISGEGCYLLKVNASSQQELIDLLDRILQFGNYKINISVGAIK